MHPDEVNCSQVGRREFSGMMKKRRVVLCFRQNERAFLFASLLYVI